MLVIDRVIITLRDKGLMNEAIEYALRELDEELSRVNSCVIPFGKYKGKTVKDVKEFDMKYLQWLVKQEYMNKFEDLKKEIIS